MSFNYVEFDTIKIWIMNVIFLVDFQQCSIQCL